MELQSGNAKFGSKSAFFGSCDLDIWRMTLKNNRAPHLCYFKFCASFHSHWRIQTGVTVRKRLSWALTSVTLTFDLWPWPFAWISRLSLVITPENFMMMPWWEHGEKGVTDGRTDWRTDGRTERSALRAAWSQLKMNADNYVRTLLENLLDSIENIFGDRNHQFVFQHDNAPSHTALRTVAGLEQQDISTI